MLKTNLAKLEAVYQMVVDGHLAVDETGAIWRLTRRHVGKRGKVTLLQVRSRAECAPGRQGYLQVMVAHKGIRYAISAHRLVYRCLIGPIPEGMTINHKNGITNDNRPENLELMTVSENTLHALRVLGIPTRKGEKHPLARLAEADVREIYRRRDLGEGLLSIARDYGISIGQVSDIYHGKRWRHLNLTGRNQAKAVAV